MNKKLSQNRKGAILSVWGSKTKGELGKKIYNFHNLKSKQEK